jgi:hypothetical protein
VSSQKLAISLDILVASTYTSLPWSPVFAHDGLLDWQNEVFWEHIYVDGFGLWLHPTIWIETIYPIDCGGSRLRSANERADLLCSLLFLCYFKVLSLDVSVVKIFPAISHLVDDSDKHLKHDDYKIY